ncbi:homoserine dehydrogenase [Bacillota bacterium]
MKELRLLMLGFGNAGRAFAGLLVEKHREIADCYGYEVKVVAIVTGSRGSLLNPDGIDLIGAIKEIEESGRFNKGRSDYSQISSMEAAASADYDVLLELTPLDIFTGQPAIDHIKTALDRGKHVITANKGPIAWAYKELKNKANEKGACFLHETTVMDGAPIFNMARDTLPLCRVTGIKGILNSTTNYILGEMAKGCKYEDILAEGRRRGFVEADPSMDIEGWDAAAKTAALMNVLMDAGITPMDIIREGIEKITAKDIEMAANRGNVIKLLCYGRMENGLPVGSVRPEEIPKEDLFACIEGTTSAVSITTDLMKTITIVEEDPDIEQTAYGPLVDLLTILKKKIMKAIIPET